MMQTKMAKKKFWFSKDQLIFLAMVIPGTVFLLIFSMDRCSVY